MDKGDWQTLILAQLLVLIPVLCLSEIKRNSPFSKKPDKKAVDQLLGGIVLNRWLWLFFSVIEGIGAFFLLRDSSGNAHAVSPLWSMAVALLLIWQLLLVLWMEVLLQMQSLKWAAASALVCTAGAWAEVVFSWQGASEAWACLFMLPMVGWQMGVCGVLFYKFRLEEKWTLPSSGKSKKDAPYNEHSVSSESTPPHPAEPSPTWQQTPAPAEYERPLHSQRSAVQSAPQIHGKPRGKGRGDGRHSSLHAHHTAAHSMKPPPGYAYSRGSPSQRVADAIGAVTVPDEEEYFVDEYEDLDPESDIEV